MANTIRSFSEIYKSIYDKPSQWHDAVFAETKSIINKSISTGLGHPQVTDVEIGETIPGSLIVFFMDIRGFTKMSIALDNEELVKILQAITAASIISIRQYGGYVAEFTGDGVMAYFGQGYTTTEKDAFNSLRTCSFLMHGIKEVVNQYLDKLLDETVKVGMGIEYGNVLWTRIGLLDINQVKPISEVSFVAGKNSSHASSWEVIMGKNIADWVPDTYKEEYEPYSFQKDNKKYTYERFSFNWESFYTEFCEDSYELERALISNKLPALKSITVLNDGSPVEANAEKNINKGPRPLKDRPFFR
ncbi:adenylate/guanylate cyclase domain-containing protein [Lutispora saccharofermentans]|uniref:Adenylate/guanylate cyclase domain-containing protein n=1 Tax=Lutispora saccharofermentans TaxID=3024236 RepID=A0ABT1NI22_9FIRM|nr:adenylate/guanylate cyclase domain-containing protein [Lutispora saccharofermentans]MCQ1529516.1 adenylate/guanylate cyclase domain-containing protein [Lutispora saccharofermentans]